MKESLLNVKSKEFALQIIKLCNQIKSDKKEEIANAISSFYVTTVTRLELWC